MFRQIVLIVVCRLTDFRRNLAFERQNRVPFKSPGVTMIRYTLPLLMLAVTASVVNGQATNESKRPTIEVAARNYRIQTYDTFRTQRAEYDRRIAEGEEAIKRYKDATESEQNEILTWFVQSTSGLRPETAVSDRFLESELDESTDLEIDNVPHVESQLSMNSLVGDENAISTSVVRNNKYGVSNRSRTLSILGSVGRAVTMAVAQRGTGKGQTEPIGELIDVVGDGPQPVEDVDLIEQRFEVVGERDEPTPATSETLEVSDGDVDDEEVADEGAGIEAMILEMPVDDDDELEPTPETFEPER